MSQQLWLLGDAQSRQNLLDDDMTFACEFHRGASTVLLSGSPTAPWRCTRPTMFGNA
jgi:hypothetical protein